MIEGLTTYKAWDPNVVKLADGRYRMFYYGSEAKEGKHKILSAASNDGVYWVQEEGVRYEDYGITDPAVVKIGDAWKMYLFVHAERKIISASSTRWFDFQQRCVEFRWRGSWSSRSSR